MVEEKDNKKILELLKENKELIIMIPTFVLTLLGVLYGIICYYYSLNAEQYYGIPKFYFYDNLQTDYIMKVMSFIATIMVFFSPFMVKRFLRKHKLKNLESLGFSFLIAFLVFYLSLMVCDSLIINTLHITGQDSILLCICVSVSIISWIVYFFVFKTVLSEHLNVDKQEIEKDKNRNDVKVVLKTKENTIALSFAIIVTISIVMISALIINSPLFTPQNKKNYEIIQTENLECNVLVGSYKDSAIIMKGKIEYQNKGSDSHLKIKKGFYRVESTEEKDLIYCGFNFVTCE